MLLPRDVIFFGKNQDFNTGWHTITFPCPLQPPTCGYVWYYEYYQFSCRTTD